MSEAPEFDVIIYGSTGYTGRLVAEYMAQQYGTSGDAPKWAMAGRNLEKLEEVRDLIGAPKETPLVVADSDDPASIDMMASRTRVVLTTVGPYQLYGDEVVAACVRHGTHYVDLCGEPGWMRAMIDEHQKAAEESGAQICFSCGFDSIPFDGRHFFGRHRSQPEGNNEGDRQKSGPCEDIGQQLRPDPRFQGRRPAQYDDPEI